MKSFRLHFKRFAKTRSQSRQTLIKNNGAWGEIPNEQKRKCSTFTLLAKFERVIIMADKQATEIWHFQNNGKVKAKHDA